MSLTIAIGGLLFLLEIGSYETIAGLAILGLFPFFLDLYQKIRSRSARFKLLRPVRSKNILWLIPPALLALFLYASSIECGWFNWYDDLVAYMVFIRRMFETGTILEPYSWRRLSTYGGQQFLQAQIVVGGSDYHINMFDMGLCPIIFGGLIFGLFKPRTPGQWAMASFFTLAAILVPVPRFNTQAQLSGVVLFFTLLRTLPLWNIKKSFLHNILPCAIIGLVASATATLRMNFLPGVVLALIAYAVVQCWRGRDLLKKSILESLLTLVATILSLLPWTLVLYKSSGSLFYPIMKGYQHPDYTILGLSLSSLQKIEWVLGFLTYLPTFVLIFPFILLLTRKQYRKAILPFMVAAWVTAIATALAFTRSDFENIYRYSFSMLFAGVFLLIALEVRRQRTPWRAWLALTFLFLIHATAYDQRTGIPIQQTRLTMGWEWLHDSATSPVAFVDFSLPVAYRQAQQLVPPGEPILVAATHALFLDYRRNPIFVVDLCGAASPPPGLPIFDGPDAIKHYLKSQGIHYVLTIDYDRTFGLYERKFWSRIGANPSRFPHTDQVMYRFMLCFMDASDYYLKNDELLYNKSTVRLVRLK